jgi:hypothetical protein
MVEFFVGAHKDIQAQEGLFQGDYNSGIFSPKTMIGGIKGNK